MTKAEIYPMPEFFDRYIHLADDVELNEALETSRDEFDNLPIDLWKSIGDKVYAPGKWTIRDILQHMIDTERIFACRALCFARGETARMPSFDEEEYARNTIANERSFDDLLTEFKLVRETSIMLFKSFTDEMLLRSGLSFRGTYSVLGIGFIMVGHQRWHLNIIKERYETL
ncbi:DinB family protein [Emticicia sp. 21SJ11W-3]|uniref:DinB family protein n=1 Tax=Emticicia sp. 21SJ11W-3 TaxID=2916755 RepID=UPI0020A12B72|nr:DinB family protein [Emticicia sp. 21SJ11W-3]UTA67100.1 DinB family protein [Emticicia sp. 21SJ11W-3]